MDAFVYRADLYCGACAARIFDRLTKMKTPKREDSYMWPQGPHSDGGGEADKPQHCGVCAAFLENPLTFDGYEYVGQAIYRYVRYGVGSGKIIKEWAVYYRGEDTGLDIAIDDYEREKPEDWT